MILIETHGDKWIQNEQLNKQRYMWYIELKSVLLDRKILADRNMSYLSECLLHVASCITRLWYIGFIL